MLSIHICTYLNWVNLILSKYSCRILFYYSWQKSGSLWEIHKTDLSNNSSQWSAGGAGLRSRTRSASPRDRSRTGSRTAGWSLRRSSGRSTRSMSRNGKSEMMVRIIHEMNIWLQQTIFSILEKETITYDGQLGVQDCHYHQPSHEVMQHHLYRTSNKLGTNLQHTDQCNMSWL